MDKTLTRRNLIGRAGLALGGAMTLGVLNACGDDDETNVTPTPEPEAGPQVADYPYQQHLAATYQLDLEATKEAAYHQYYAGGCCHGAYNAILKHLADTAGAPFNLLPLDFGAFGASGIAGYGSICGAVLGGVLAINFIVPNVAPTGGAPAQSNVRNRMMAELMRWYEGAAFPVYSPAALDAKETGLTMSFATADLSARQTVAASHLCHASVTKWCAANGNVSPSSPDKKARCARLTADVTGKVVEMLNGYLATGAFTADTTNPTTGCVGCHSQTATAPAAPVASGMDCGSCHPAATHPLPATHSAQTDCDICH